MTVLVTGAAGFIGSFVAARLLDAGRDVLGVDNFSPYYDPNLKEARWARLEAHKGFTGHRVDLADKAPLQKLCDAAKPTAVIHLAAQPGVRYGLENPDSYISSNIIGTVNLLEVCRTLKPKHFVFASTSSVYGAGRAMPYGEDQLAGHPLSLYAATKRADELLAHSYAHLFNIPATGLRFFTVYGPWGRPDMAPFKFTSRMLKGEPIDVHNEGDMARDFTYVADIAEGVVRVLDKIPTPDAAWNAADPSPASSGVAPYRVYNIGRGEPVKLMDFIATLEKLTGKKAVMKMVPIQPGEVLETWCDVSALDKAVGYKPKVSLEEGLRETVAWFRDYYKV